MPTEDKLNHDERLRLECLAQAIGNNIKFQGASNEKIVSDAKVFEKYVRGVTDADQRQA